MFRYPHNLTILLISMSLLHTLYAVSPYISIRPQGQRNDLDTTGWSSQVLHKNSSWYGDLTLSGNYAQTFRNTRLTRMLFDHFTPRDCTTLSIKGSNVSTRTNEDLLADWFYVAKDYQGTISFDPMIKSATVALTGNAGLEEWLPGLYISCKAPFTWAQWHLHDIFFTIDEGTVTTPSGTYLSNADDFFCGEQNSFSTTFTASPLAYARFGCHDCTSSKCLSKTNLTDIQLNIGYNIPFDSDKYALSVYGRLVIPTGNAPKSQKLFEPIAGNGRLWEVGLGLQTQDLIWKSKDEESDCSLFLDACFTHMFNAKQTRVFDLKGKPLSRYMTAGHFVNGLPNNYVPIANLTATSTKVYVGIQADIVALLNYTCNSWSYDLGYNLWVRSAEKFSSKKLCSNGLSSHSYGIARLGDTTTYSAGTIVAQGAPDATPVFIKEQDIDYNGGSTKGFSNAVFAHIEYSWLKHYGIPRLGIGGSLEIGGTPACKEKTCSSKNTALSQWLVWLKGGVSF